MGLMKSEPPTVTGSGQTPVLLVYERERTGNRSAKGLRRELEIFSRETHVELNPCSVNQRLVVPSNTHVGKILGVTEEKQSISSSLRRDVNMKGTHS